MADWTSLLSLLAFVACVSGNVCPFDPLVDIYRWWEGGALRKDDLESEVDEPCSLAKCTYTKSNSLQASTCTDLLGVREELLRSSEYTALFRHEMTNHEFRQRLLELSPAGWRRSYITGQSLKDAGISVASYVSSGYKRSKDTAIAMSEGLEDEIDSETLNIDVKNLNRLASADGKGKEDANLLIRTRMRQWLVESWDDPAIGSVRLAVSHGSRILAALSVSLDEGDCLFAKPASETYGNEEPLDVVLSQKTFVDEFKANVPRIDLLAVLSAEQLQKMAKCTQLSEDIKSASPAQILSADTDYNLEITKEEFDAWCDGQILLDPANCKQQWSTVLRLQARPHWKSDTEATTFHVGEHAYFNSGFREGKFCNKGWAFPYRATTLDTVRPTLKEAQTLLKPLELLLRATSSDVDSAKLLDCTLTENTLDIFSSCTERRDLLKYKTLPTRDFPDDIVFDTNVFYRSGIKYPYSTTIDIPTVENPMVKLAMCLVQEGYASAKDMVASMECPLSSVADRTVSVFLLVALALFWIV